MKDQEEVKSERSSGSRTDELDQQKTPVLSFGEKAVGLSFNPGGHQDVNKIKRLCADLIDELNDLREKAKAENNGEKIAQYTLAIRDIQSGQMWGVKAATWQY